MISRTGWTGEVGYEIYLRDRSRGGDLWDRIMEAGRPHDIRPIAPSEARRIEAGIFNYGSDMTIENNPFEVMGLERLVEQQEADYIGKAALERIRVEGVSRRLVGVEVAGDALPFELSEKRPALVDGEAVGTVTDLIWSPRLEKNIGYVWLPTELSGAGQGLWRSSPRTAAAGPAPRRRSRSSTRRSECRSGTPDQVAGASSTAASGGSDRNAPRRQAMNRAIETTATMIVEIALIWGVTPNLIEL